MDIGLLLHKRQLAQLARLGKDIAWYREREAICHARGSDAALLVTRREALEYRAARLQHGDRGAS